MRLERRQRDALCFSSLGDLAGRLRRREVTASALVEAFLERIEEVDGGVNAYVTVVADAALERARQADRDIARGCLRGALHGVPIAIKDLDDVAGVPTSYGSPALANRTPPVESAGYIQRLTDSGAIVLGKTNVPEFGHKAITDNALFGPTSTPFDLSCNAGGSSGGSAAAVAAGLAAGAQGGDGGGSVRIPAALCGVVGFTATYGRVAQVSRPNAFSAHTPFLYAGPITRTVEDSALLLEVMIGHDRRDPFSVPSDGAGLVAATRRSVEGLRVAYLPDFGGYPVAADVRSQVDAAVAALGIAGAVVEPISSALPLHHSEVTAMWMRQMGSNYLSIVEGLRASGIDLEGERRELVDPAVLAMIESASALTARDQQRDQFQRTRLVDWLEALLEDHDLLVGPTLAVSHVANAGDRRTLGPSAVMGEQVDPAIGWCLTPLTNFTGHPAASIPAGLTPAGHPVGLHLVGRRFADDQILAACAAVERVAPWAHTYTSETRKLT